MAANKRSWSDLSQSQHRAIYLAGAVESIVTSLALRDLARRPSSQVRGPKLLWFLGCFVQPVGPLAYLLLGRAKRRV